MVTRTKKKKTKKKKRLLRKDPHESSESRTRKRRQGAVLEEGFQQNRGSVKESLNVREIKQTNEEEKYRH